MPTPEEQFTEALKDVNDTLEEVKVTLVEVRDVMSITPIDAENVPNRVMVTDGSGNTTTSSITTTQLNYLSGLTGNVQSLLDNKLNKKLSNLNAVVITDGYGNVTVHPKTTATELDYLDGVTSNIQVQFANTQTALNAKTDKYYFYTDGYARKLIQKVSTGTENLYVKLCTWTTTQDGQKLMIKCLGSEGFNAYENQIFELGINVNTSNGHDEPERGYFAAQCYMVDSRNHVDTVRVYLIQHSSTACEVWVKLPTYCTMAYEILSSDSNTIDVEPVYQASAPTTDSKYVYTPRALAKSSGWAGYGVLVTSEDGKLELSPTVTRTELNCLDGVTGNVQTQLNAKQPKNTGTANRALVSNGSGEIGVSAVTASQLNMLKNVTSDVQTQINDKQTQITSLNNKVAANTLVGEVKWLAFSDSVSGWLLCDGRAVSRADYAALFAAIGTTWGAGDGSTTFNLPNLIDKTVWGGSAAGGYKEAGLPDHDHSYSSYPRHGAEAHPDLTTARWCDGFEGTETAKVTGTSTKASASNSIYGKSTTVQPPAAVLRPVIKY